MDAAAILRHSARAAALNAIVDDDPEDGPSVGPAGHGAMGGINPNLGIHGVVVWSGAWDRAIWDSLMERARSGDGCLMIVLTQPLHHDAWTRGVKKRLILEIKPWACPRNS